MNMKPQFLTKSGHYIVPSSSTALILSLGYGFATKNQMMKKDMNYICPLNLNVFSRLLYYFSFWTESK